MRVTPLASALALTLTLLPTIQPAAWARPQAPVTCTDNSGNRSGTTYFLADDLDCTDIHAILLLAPGDRFELRGHTLTGLRIWASSPVKILGPGAIVGSPADGIRHSGGLLTVSDVTISGATRYGIVSLAGKIKLRNATVTGNGIDGVATYRKLDARNSTITGNARFGVSTRPDGTLVEGGAPCTETAKAVVALASTTVSGNGVAGTCGVTEACADVATCTRLPKLKASTCGTSYLLESGIPGSTLGICSAD